MLVVFLNILYTYYIKKRYSDCAIIISVDLVDGKYFSSAQKPTLQKSCNCQRTAIICYICSNEKIF